MFFDSPEDIQKIAAHVGCAIFVLPKEVKVKIDKAIVLEPEEKTVVTIEQVRKIQGLINKKQIAEQFIIIRPADALSEPAANAFLKNLEEPKNKVHFILITDVLSRILPTILSRSAIYVLRPKMMNDCEILANDRVKALAKRMIVAKNQELVRIADEIAQKKSKTRSYALEVLSVAIEMLYKSYFITKKAIFLKKIPKFLKAYNNIEKNGHIKLHLVADLF